MENPYSNEHGQTETRGTLGLQFLKMMRDSSSLAVSAEQHGEKKHGKLV